MNEVEFWKSVKIGSQTNCWLWTGTSTDRGYGYVIFDNKRWYVTRLAFVFKYGDIPSTHCIVSCSSNRLCVNPHHISIAPKIQPIDERFWGKVDIKSEQECWEWKAAKTSKGYGKFSDKSNGIPWITAHRFSYKLHYGIDPTDSFVCHSCDNPSCVNPHHLWLGDSGDNNRDARDKGRRYQPTVAGESNGRATLSQDDVLFIRSHFKHDMTAKQLAEKFGVSISSIYSVIYRKTWNHIP